MPLPRLPFGSSSIWGICHFVLFIDLGLRLRPRKNCMVVYPIGARGTHAVVSTDYFFHRTLSNYRLLKPSLRLHRLSPKRTPAGFSRSIKPTKKKKKKMNPRFMPPKRLNWGKTLLVQGFTLRQERLPITRRLMTKKDCRITNCRVKLITLACRPTTLAFRLNRTSGEPP